MRTHVTIIEPAARYCVCHYYCLKKNLTYYWTTRETTCVVAFIVRAHSISTTRIINSVSFQDSVVVVVWNRTNLLCSVKSIFEVGQHFAKIRIRIYWHRLWLYDGAISAHLTLDITQVRPSLGLTYIHTCRSNVHTPRELDRHAVELPTETFIVFHAQANSSNFGLMGSKVSQNVLFRALDADEPPCKIWRQ